MLYDCTIVIIQSYKEGCLIGWTLNADRPIYAQIIDKLSSDIASGIYAPGDKLPSVRDFAIEAAVNPNTMQKALTELERLGLVYSKRTSGRYITEDTQLIKNYRENLAIEEIASFLSRMEQLGFDQAQTLAAMKDYKPKEA